MPQNDQKIEIEVDIKAKVDDLLSGINQSKNALGQIASGFNNKALQSEFDSLTATLKKLREKSSQPFTSQSEFNSLIKNINSAEAKYKQLQETIKTFKGLSNSEKIKLMDDATIKRISSADKGIKDFDKSIQNLNKKEEEYNNTLKKQNQQLKELEEKQKKLNRSAGGAKSSITKLGFSGIDEAKAKKKTISSSLAKGKEKLKNLNSSGASTEEISAQQQKVSKLQQEYDKLNAAVEKYDRALKEQKSGSDAIQKLNNQISETKNNFNSLSQSQFKDAFSKLSESAKNAGVDLTGLQDATKENANIILEKMGQVAPEALQKFNESVNQSENNLQQLGQGFDDISNKTSQSREEFTKLDERLQNKTAFLDRIKMFTGLTGAIRIARNITRSAFNTIKELDAQMTEMAVVTDLGVGDYWSQLPEYTKRANELGVSIKSAYEAATLYYQQGLKTNEVNQISVSTLKMARIAGLSAEDATNKMTAALRGFNMEITQTNADRIADVYSKLAAITASNVNEISNAMTKTASIAASAGMEFETTAAFLSQIIN